VRTVRRLEGLNSTQSVHTTHMSLSAGQKTLSADLAKMWARPTQSVAVSARIFADSVRKFAQSGVVKTTLSASGAGIGGFDRSSPGIGLSAAKPLLEEDLISAWAERSANSDVTAERVSKAIFQFLSEARVVTTLKSPATLPSVGAVPTSSIGGIDSSAPGKGLGPSQSKFEAELVSIWTCRDVKPVELQAERLSAAIHAYMLEIKIEVSGTYSSGIGKESGRAI